MYSNRGSGRSEGGFRSRPNNGKSFGDRRTSSRPFDPKRTFKADYIDEKLFTNKAVQLAEQPAYVHANNFSDFDLGEVLMKNLTKAGLVSPSPIQDQAIPVALKGTDVIGIASTGTGKTAAFLLPIIYRLMNEKGLKAMVMCPTRELAEQVDTAFRQFTAGTYLKSALCVGGASMYIQLKRLTQNPDLIVGTPGRIQDLIDRRKIRTQEFSIVVLDEADRMLDMGFITDMRAILGAMPKDKQTLFFSATFQPAVKALCSDFMNDPVTITIASRDTSSNVEQEVIKYSGAEDRFAKLLKIIDHEKSNRILIFRETKRDTDRLAIELQKRDYRALAIHGDLRNVQRKRALEELGAGRAQIVIATDVAARGIDVKDITHVVNYDIPKNYETYIHRIGRTGRAGSMGHSYTFVPEKSAGSYDRPAAPRARAPRAAGEWATRSPRPTSGRGDDRTQSHDRRDSHVKEGGRSGKPAAKRGFGTGAAKKDFTRGGGW